MTVMLSALGSFYFVVQLRQLRQILNVLHGLGLVVGAHFAHRAAQGIHLLHDRVPHVLQVLRVIFLQEESDVAIVYFVGVRFNNARNPGIHQNARVRFLNEEQRRFGRLNVRVVGKHAVHVLHEIRELVQKRFHYDGLVGRHGWMDQCVDCWCMYVCRVS